MGTFITDRLQHLNTDLVQLFHLDAQAPLEGGMQDAAVSSPPSHKKQRHQRAVSGQAEIALRNGLRSSIDILDLRSGVVPSMERVLLEIEKVEALSDKSISTTVSESQDGNELARLQHLFIAKCTISVYLNLLDNILNATLPLAAEIEYWQSLLDNRSWKLLYILQTSPHRFFLLTKSVIESTREHIDSLIGTSQVEDKATHILQLLQYFPTFLSRHLISQPVSFPEAIHYEISHHRRHLQQLREYQAECLGLLAEQGLHLAPECLEQEGFATGQTEEFVQEQVSKTICLMERVLDKASKDTHKLTDTTQQRKFSSSFRAASRSLTIIGDLRGVASLSSNETLSHLKDLIQIQIPRYTDETETRAQQFYRPSWITRIWIPTLIGYFGLKYGLQYVSEHRADLDELIDEAWETVRRFVADWVWEPSRRIMTIIRHSDDQGSLQMLGNESLKSDIASLERMVLDFGKEHLHMGPEDLERLSHAVHNGDISAVMRAYEQDLKAPLKGAVTGNLLQTLLIQVQKTKVDVEVAMAALDKLLKANELNFAFLAVGPSLLLLWAVSSQAKSTWQRIAGRNLGVVSLQMKNSLRQVERLLNLASTDGDDVARTSSRAKNMDSESHRSTEHGQASNGQFSDDYENIADEERHGRPIEGSVDSSRSSSVEPLFNTLQQINLSSDRLSRIRAKKGKVPYRTQGLILCEVHLLRTFASRLTRTEGLRDKVLEDLREIEESSLTVHQRLRTTKRMYRTYGFLGLHH
ncbi:nuclear control of ATPase protein 2 [Entomortierella parvispora]|uniref:Nuclear control of ATPase protein 2 n=1 Tax=Entomortierella parvispora TaxID=205924 RepID=A0A9P3H546_9FUNG|nr:nuclear control of ATPase protein 2 [Entomortierella parvispora]